MSLKLVQKMKYNTIILNIPNNTTKMMNITKTLTIASKA